jgi:urease accessory protein
MSKFQLSASNQKKHSRVVLSQRFVEIAILIGLGLLSAATPASAHHALGGRMPANFFEGFLSGLAHPIIGLDHFAFVVAIGLLCIGQKNRFFIPAAFILAALAGTGIHLLRVDLPATEFFIAASVIVFGAMLAISTKSNWLVLAGLGAIAGLFHGYAYGESIVGAQMTPLIAYLAGFSLIQYAIAMSACFMGKVVSEKFTNQFSTFKRLAGFAICAIGIVFLTNALV